jgi:hypothetical protein
MVQHSKYSTNCFAKLLLDLYVADGRTMETLAQLTGFAKGNRIWDFIHGVALPVDGDVVSRLAKTFNLSEKPMMAAYGCSLLRARRVKTECISCPIAQKLKPPRNPRYKS